MNELVQIHQGRELHESPDALEFGLKVVDYMRREAVRLSRELNMKFVLGQSLAETTAYRFARLDLKYFSPAAGRYVKGDIAEGAIYYTNSTHLNVSADVTPLQKVIQEGLFHKYLGGEVFTHLQLGAQIRATKNSAGLSARFSMIPAIVKLILIRNSHSALLVKKPPKG